MGAFAAFLLVVSGCTGSGTGPGPTASTTSARSMTHTVPPAPTPTILSVPPDVPTTGPNADPAERPPVMPVLATRHTAAGAKAFAGFFIKTIDWGFATLNGAYIRHYALPRCVGCAAFANGMDGDRRAGHKYIGGRLTAKPARMELHSAHVVEVAFNQTSYEETDRHGRVVGADQGHRDERFAVHLDWRGAWFVADLEVVL
jgi:hypothetical protein